MQVSAGEILDASLSEQKIYATISTIELERRQYDEKGRDNGREKFEIYCD